MISDQDSKKLEKIRKSIGDRQIIRLVPPVEPEIQTEDEESVCFLISLVDNLQKQLSASSLLLQAAGSMSKKLYTTEELYNWCKLEYPGKEKEVYDVILKFSNFLEIT